MRIRKIERRPADCDMGIPVVAKPETPDGAGQQRPVVLPKRARRGTDPRGKRPRGPAG